MDMLDYFQLESLVGIRVVVTSQAIYVSFVRFTIAVSTNDDKRYTKMIFEVSIIMLKRKK